MTVKSLVLHIGDPKTGSSSIQEVLRHRLWESPTATLIYPDQLNSFPLANALSDPKQLAQRHARYSKLAEWLGGSDADVAVVSAEQFFRVDPQVLLETLTEYVPDLVGSLRVIAYVRPHANRLVSAFMQRTKAGLYQGDMETFFKRTQNENLLHYAPRFQSWRDVFGARFTLRPMIREQLRDGDVVLDFLDFTLRGAPFTLRGQPNANTSLPLEFLAGLREVQSVLKRNEIAAGIRHSVGDYVGRALAKTTPGSGTKLHLSRALYEDVMAYCQSDAEALDTAFFHQPVMATALKDAGSDVIAINQDTLARMHYSEEAVQNLRVKARSLVGLFKKRPAAWNAAFEREIGQRPDDVDKKVPPAVRMHVTRVDSILTEIAAIISAPSRIGDT
ncbi:MAG: hypothetical protein ABI832_12205 [bacterium]